MPVEIIIDNWSPDKKKYRFETFCYGSLSCKLYKSGPVRRVEGRNGMVYARYTKAERVQVKLEFLRMLTKLELNPDS